MAIPSGTLVADIVIKTLAGFRRNRMYYKPDANPTGLLDLEDCANGIKDHYAANYAALMPTLHFFERVECRWYGAGSTAFEANSTSGSLAGANNTDEEDQSAFVYAGSADILPDEVSLIIQVTTGTIGRSKRGRRFITGLHEAVNYAGRVDEDAKTLCRNLAARMSEDIDIAPTTGSLETTLHARHYDRKNNIMVPITKCYAVGVLGTRKDRRKPLQLERL